MGQTKQEMFEAMERDAKEALFFTVQDQIEEGTLYQHMTKKAYDFMVSIVENYESFEELSEKQKEAFEQIYEEQVEPHVEFERLMSKND